MNALQGKCLAVVGAGNIGRILLKRLLAAEVPAANLLVCDSDEARAAEVSRCFGARACPLTDELLVNADIFLLAPPPRAIPEILEALRSRLRPGQVVVSFAAGVPMSRLAALLPAGVSAARVMPNAPSLVGQGMNPVAYGSGISSEARGLVEFVLKALGETLVVKDERMNWCAGLTGAAMRSVLPALQGMTQAGIEAGFAEGEARRLAAQVMLGTATLVLESGLSFDQLKSLTPMQTVDEVGLSRIFADAARAAKEKTDRLQEKLAEA